MKQHVSAGVAAIALALAMSGCSKKEETPRPAVSQGPVAARVNAQDIPVQQVTAALGRTPAQLPPEQAKAAEHQVLERLIDQELLVQQAKSKKLDSDPRVVQALEAARQEILARAYLEQVAGAAAKPTEADIKTYYDQHPELFKERRVYNLREIAINAKPDFLPALQAQMAQAKSLNDVVEWLKSQNVQFATNAGVKPAEQLPLEILPKFHQLKDGQKAIVPAPGGILVVEIVASQSQPLDEKQAAPIIEQFLTNQKRTDVAAAEVKKLREAAKVEYVGDFAKHAEEGKSVMETAPAAPAGAAPQPAAAAQPVVPPSPPVPSAGK